MTDDDSNAGTDKFSDLSNNIQDYFNKDNSLLNRKIQIDNNYIKQHRDYISLIKILVYAFILIIPLLILTKIKFIPKTISMFFISLILFLALLYIIYHLVFKKDAFLKRDKKNYDLIKIDDNVRNRKLVKSGIVDQNSGLLSRVYKDCVGDQCCTDFMTYDGNIKQCVPTNINVGKYWQKINNIEEYKNNNLDVNDISNIIINDSGENIKQFFSATTISSINSNQYIILSDDKYNNSYLSNLANNKIKLGDYSILNSGDYYIIVSGVETFTNMSDSYLAINPCTNSCFTNNIDTNIDFFKVNISNNNHDNKESIEWFNSLRESILSPFNLHYKEGFNSEYYLNTIKEISNNIFNKN